MTIDSPTHPDSAFHSFDESVERVLGADMRLIYGMAVPILIVTGLIVTLALTPAVWLAATIVGLEVAALAVVVYGFVGMLNEPAEDEADLA